MTALWRIADQKLISLNSSKLDLESSIHSWIEGDPGMLDPDLLIIGREVVTWNQKRIDLLAISSEGDVVIIELKRDKTPKLTVAQILEYAAWVSRLSAEQINNIANDYLSKKPDLTLEKAFESHFQQPLPEAINSSHRMIIVASRFDEASKAIVEYLSETHSVPINAAFFNVFSEGSQQFLVADWLMDQETVVQRSEAKVRLPWTGAWYVNIKENENGRRWSDMERLGFVSAGGGPQWSGPLAKLEESSHIYVHLTGAGYVGHGVVTGQRVLASQFSVNGKTLDPLRYRPHDDQPERAEFVVPVRWVKKLPADSAIKFPNYFASTHVVCKLRDTKTLDVLKAELGSNAAGDEPETERTS